jgi:hypothetical protein
VLDTLLALLIKKDVITKSEMESEFQTTVKILESEFKKLNGNDEPIEQSYYYGPVGEA